MDGFISEVNFETKDEMFRYLAEYFFFKKDYEEAVKCCLMIPEEETNHFIIGFKYFVAKDYLSASKQYLRCINAEEPGTDEPGCYIGLGILCLNGLGVEKDIKKANRLIKKGLDFVQEAKLYANKRYRRWLTFWEDLAKGEQHE